MRLVSRQTIFVAVLLVSALLVKPAVAAIYYVAPTGGSDANTGTDITKPFATVTKAVSVIHSGDTIYLRGGSYNLTSALTISSSKSGTLASPVNLFAYPGDSAAPVLDFRGETFSGANGGATGVDLQANYWHVKGLTVQYAADTGINISGSNNTLERLVTRQNQDSGLILKQSSTRIPANNLILNCDSYGNFDYRTDSSAPGGGNADGFAAKFRDIGPGNYFIGDRAFNNSDDGYDLWGATSAVTIINSQAFHNGLSSTFRTPTGGPITGYDGNGNGFKLGQDSSTHILTGDIAWGNPHNGFDINGNARDTVGPGIIQHGVTVYNNTAFSNGTVSGVNYRFDDTFPHVLKNNISLSGTVNINAANVSDHNTWNSGFSVAASDFVSTTDPAIDGIFHPIGVGGDRDGTTNPTYPIAPARDATTGNITNPTGFLQLKFGDHLLDLGTTSFNDATGAPILLSNSPTVLNFTGVTITLPGYSIAGPDLGALELFPKRGDFNRDGQITSADISAMLQALVNLPGYQSERNLSSYDLATIADIDNSGQIDNADLQALLYALIHGTLSGAIAAQDVPEPPTLVLAALALIGTMILARRAHHSSAAERP